MYDMVSVCGMKSMALRFALGEGGSGTTAKIAATGVSSSGAGARRRMGAGHPLLYAFRLHAPGSTAVNVYVWGVQLASTLLADLCQKGYVVRFISTRRCVVVSTPKRTCVYCLNAQGNNFINAEGEGSTGNLKGM